MPAQRQPAVRPLQLLLAGVALHPQDLVVTLHGGGAPAPRGGKRRPAARPGWQTEAEPAAAEPSGARVATAPPREELRGRRWGGPRRAQGGRTGDQRCGEGWQRGGVLRSLCPGGAGGRVSSPSWLVRAGGTRVGCCSHPYCRISVLTPTRSQITRLLVLEFL